MRAAVACLMLAGPALLFAQGKDAAKDKPKDRTFERKDKDAAAPKDDARAAWKELVLEGRCSVRLPALPERKSVKEGGADVVMYTLSANDGKVAYVVAYNDLPAKVEDKAVEKALVAGRDRAKDDLEGKLLAGPADPDFFDFNHDPKTKYRGLRFTLELPKPAGALYRARLVVADRTLFQVAVAGPADWVKEEEGDATTFLQSFKLPPRK